MDWEDFGCKPSDRFFSVAVRLNNEYTGPYRLQLLEQVAKAEREDSVLMLPIQALRVNPHVLALLEKDGVVMVGDLYRESDLSKPFSRHRRDLRRIIGLTEYDLHSIRKARRRLNRVGKQKRRST